MTNEEALQVLKDHNAWSRDKGDTENIVMREPKIIGEAIDAAIAYMQEKSEPVAVINVDSADIAKRLRRVCNALSLSNAVPDDDAGLYNCMFSVLGMVARELETEKCSHVEINGINEMVSRFLGWQLPANFSPDAGISFNPFDHQRYNSPHWPIGTNLFTADQAKEMIEYVIGSAPQRQQPLKRLSDGHIAVIAHESRFNITGNYTQLANAIMDEIERINRD